MTTNTKIMLSSDFSTNFDTISFTERVILVDISENVRWRDHEATKVTNVENPHVNCAKGLPTNVFN